MKKYFLILIFFFLTNHSYSSTNIVYLDLQFIIDNSDLGISFKKEIKKIQSSNNVKISEKEKVLKNKEIEFNNQKNILNDTEKKNKLNELSILVKNYQTFRNDLNNKILEENKKYSKKILSILNPLITKYVEENQIDLVIEKKHVIVGIKSKDITMDLLKIFNKNTKDMNISNGN